MIKDFDKWNIHKQLIDQANLHLQFSQLDGDKYQQAINAHDKGLPVRVRGDLLKKTQSELTNIIDFEVIKNDTE